MSSSEEETGNKKRTLHILNMESNGVERRPQRRIQRRTFWRERQGQESSEVTGDSASLLYAMTLVTIYMASKFTELVRLKHYDVLEQTGFFIFLYLTGIAYILYIFISIVYFRIRGDAFGLENAKVYTPTTYLTYSATLWPHFAVSVMYFLSELK